MRLTFNDNDNYVLLVIMTANTYEAISYRLGAVPGHMHYFPRVRRLMVTKLRFKPSFSDYRAHVQSHPPVYPFFHSINAKHLCASTFPRTGNIAVNRMDRIPASTNLLYFGVGKGERMKLSQ